jgi:hypothetical protein
VSAVLRGLTRPARGTRSCNTARRSPNRNARSGQRDQDASAGNDAPLIGERAATRGRGATRVAMSRRV